MGKKEKRQDDNKKDDIVGKVSKAYEDGADSYEFPVDDGDYWRKVRRYKNLKEIIENN